MLEKMKKLILDMNFDEKMFTDILNQLRIEKEQEEKKKNDLEN